MRTSSVSGLSTSGFLLPGVAANVGCPRGARSVSMSRLYVSTGDLCVSTCLASLAQREMPFLTIEQGAYKIRFHPSSVPVQRADPL